MKILEYFLMKKNGSIPTPLGGIDTVRDSYSRVILLVSFKRMLYYSLSYAVVSDTAINDSFVVWQKKPGLILRQLTLHSTYKIKGCYLGHIQYTIYLGYIQS